MKLFVLLLLVGFTSAVVLQQRGLGCTLCKDLINDLEQDVEGDEGNIIDKANAACDKITKGNAVLDPICKDMVDKEIKNVEDDIKNNEPPEKVCKKMKMCK